MDVKLPSYKMFKLTTHKKTIKKDERARCKGEALWSKFSL